MVGLRPLSFLGFFCEGDEVFLSFFFFFFFFWLPNIEWRRDFE